MNGRDRPKADLRAKQNSCSLKGTSTIYVLRKMMRVIDHEPQWWFLLEEEGAFFLDVNCNHSFVGYTFLLRLSPQEEAGYFHEGRIFIDRLAKEIQDSAPILAISTSRFKGRDLSKDYSDKVTKAVENWRAKPSVS